MYADVAYLRSWIDTTFSAKGGATFCPGKYSKASPALFKHPLMTLESGSGQPLQCSLMRGEGAGVFMGLDKKDITHTHKQTKSIQSEPDHYIVRE